MESLANTEQFAQMRRIRMEKVRSLRLLKNMQSTIPNKSQFVHQIPKSSYYCNSSLYPSSIPSSVSIIQDSTASTKTCDGSNDKVKNRQIKNRESALLSRKRKQDEMSYLHSKVNSLEEEIQRLKSRLILYEGNNHDSSSSSPILSSFVNTNGDRKLMNGVVTVDSASSVDLDTVSVSSTDSSGDSNNVPYYQQQQQQHVSKYRHNNNNNHRIPSALSRQQQQLQQSSLSRNGTPAQNNHNHPSVKNIIPTPISHNHNNNNNRNNYICNSNSINNKCVSNLEPAEFYHLF